MPKVVCVKLQPIPKIQSALSRKCGTVGGNAFSTRAQRERMIFRKRAFPLETGGDGSAEKLGKLLKRFPRARVVDSLACVNYRALRLGESGSGSSHIRDIGPIARGDDGLVRERFGHIFGEKIERYFHQRGTASSIAKIRESAAKNIGNLGRREDWLRRLGH